MKIIKKTIINFLLIITFCNIGIISLDKKVFAADEKLETFIATSLDKGYLNSTIEIVQISNNKYKVDLIIKENILGMNYGFYITPAIVESLSAVGFECETIIDNQYAYNTFSTTTKNLGELLNRLSILPFIDFNYYISEDTKEQILKGNFQEDFYQDEREINQLIDDLFESNMFVLRFKPLSDKYFYSDAPLKNDDGYYIWLYSKNNKQIEFSTIVKPIPIYINILSYILISLFIILILFFIRFIYKKYKNSKTFSNFTNNDYHNYNY